MMSMAMAMRLLLELSCTLHVSLTTGLRSCRLGNRHLRLRHNPALRAAHSLLHDCHGV